jgi:hypothetical protein
MDDNNGNGDNGEGNHPTPEEQKQVLREEREADPEAFDKKYGTDQGEQPSGDPHNN